MEARSSPPKSSVGPSEPRTPLVHWGQLQPGPSIYKTIVKQVRELRLRDRRDLNWTLSHGYGGCPWQTARGTELIPISER